MKVLFCTDGSKTSYAAIQNFSHWVKDFTVDILCSIDWSFLPDTVSIENSEFAIQCTNSADSILDYSEKYLTESGICIGEKIKMCGSTVDSIVEVCENSNYDFVVLGSHGKKGIQKWLGSVSQEVASIIHTSTFISKGRNYRKKILFTVDSSDLSVQVINNAISSLDLVDKDIQLATVYEVPDYLFLEGNVDSNWILDVDKKQERAAMLMLNEIEQIFVRNNLSVSKKQILKGSPANQIINYTDNEDVDLVVCGVRNRKYLSKILISSVSKRVLENSKSDVLLIRP